MIGQSIPEYIFIKTCIFSLLLVTPASAVYLGTSFYRRELLSPWSRPWLGLITTAVAASEVAFYLFVYLPRYSRLQKAPVNAPPPLNRSEREALFKRCSSYISGAEYPSGWFLSPHIQRQDAIDWILWALFSADIGEADPEWGEELDGYVSGIEDVLGRKLEDGHSVDAKSMRLSFDPVKMLHRPLIWYSIVGGVDFLTSAFLMSLKFHHYTTPGWFKTFPFRPITVFSRPSVTQLPYWYRPHLSKDKLPILFIHGIGIGLYPYIPFFREILARDPEVGILAIELLPICMHITDPLLPTSATCRALSLILSSLQLPRIVIASHSYGTVVAAHMLHSPLLAGTVAATLMIDPIPLLLHLPNVAYNFVYRAPRKANEWQLWYFASRDPDIAHALSRHFFWVENVMWREELDGRRFAVVLSAKDQIVPAEEVRRYLTGEDEPEERWEKDGLEVLFFPGLDHATVFDTKERRRSLLDVLDRFIQGP